MQPRLFALGLEFLQETCQRLAVVRLVQLNQLTSLDKSLLLRQHTELQQEARKRCQSLEPMQSDKPVLSLR